MVLLLIFFSKNGISRLNDGFRRDIEAILRAVDSEVQAGEDYFVRIAGEGEESEKVNGIFSNIDKVGLRNYSMKNI